MDLPTKTFSFSKNQPDFEQKIGVFELSTNSVDNFVDFF